MMTLVPYMQNNQRVQAEVASQSKSPRPERGCASIWKLLCPTKRLPSPEINRQRLTQPSRKMIKERWRQACDPGFRGDLGEWDRLTTLGFSELHLKGNHYRRVIPRSKFTKWGQN